MDVKHKERKSQASLEFLSVVGIGMLIILPIIYLSASYKSDISDTRAVIMIKDALKELKTQGYIVYSQGEGSRKTTYVVFPSNIMQVSIESNRFFVIRAKMSYGVEDFFEEFPFNITSTSLPTTYGKYQVVITSLRDGVEYEFIKVS